MEFDNIDRAIVPTTNDVVDFGVETLAGVALRDVPAAVEDYISHLDPLSMSARKSATSLRSALSRARSEVTANAKAWKKQAVEDMFAQVDSSLEQFSETISEAWQIATDFIDDADRAFMEKRRDEMLDQFKTSLSYRSGSPSGSVEYADIESHTWLQRSMSLKNAVSEMEDRLDAIDSLVSVDDENNPRDVAGMLKHADWKLQHVLRDIINARQMRDDEHEPAADPVDDDVVEPADGPVGEPVGDGHDSNVEAEWHVSISADPATVAHVEHELSVLAANHPALRIVEVL